MAHNRKNFQSAVTTNAMKKNTNKIGKNKKLKKGKNSSATVIPIVNQNSSSIEEALLRANKKLKLYSEEDDIIPSTTSDLKSVLKSSKSVFDRQFKEKNRRVSFSLPSAESNGDLNIKNKKKKNKTKKLNGHDKRVKEFSDETNASMVKLSSNIQSANSKKISLPSSSEASSSQSSNKVTKKRKLQLPENSEEKSSKLQKKDDNKVLKGSIDNKIKISMDESHANTSNEKIQSKLETKQKLKVNGNNDVLKNSSKTNKSLSSSEIVKDKKVFEAPDDEGWEELSDCSGSDVDFDGNSEDEEAVKKDLMAFMANLDFDAAKKQTGNEVDSDEGSWEDDDNEEEEEIETTSENIGSDEEIDESLEDDDNEKEEILPVEESKALSPVKKEKLHIQPSVSNSIKASLSKFKIPDAISKKETKDNSVVNKLNSQLRAAKFRMINEQLYTMSGKKAFSMFKEDPEAFKVYHDGFKTQVSLWPLNPLDTVVEWLNAQDKKWSVADFGCGEGELSERVHQKVHSFDLVSTKPHVTACDMAHVPLPPQSINVAVFCLSLMGTNVADFVKEANRVLKNGGIMKVAEVKSRITNVEEFVSSIQKFGFKSLKKPTDNKYFINFDFKKFRNIHNKELPQITLRPCLYKRR